MKIDLKDAQISLFADGRHVHFSMVKEDAEHPELSVSVTFFLSVKSAEELRRGLVACIQEAHGNAVNEGLRRMILKYDNAMTWGLLALVLSHVASAEVVRAFFAVAAFTCMMSWLILNLFEKKR